MIGAVLVLLPMLCAAQPEVGLEPQDLGPLHPSVRWLQTERLRANLRHRCNIVPFREDVLSAKGGSSESLALRGPHVLLLQLERGERASVRVAAIDGHEVFPSTVWALISPDGRLGEVGEVAPGQAGVARLEAREPGLHRLLVNSGPASANACRLTVRAERWAVEAVGQGQRTESPVYYHSVRDFKLAGLNLDMLDFEGLRQEFVTDEGLAAWTAAVAQWAEYARRFRLRLMPAVDLGGTRWEVQAWEGCRPGLYIEHFEKYPLAPCPLDRRWWEQVVLRRGRALARLSLENPWVVGYGLDPEMYQCWDYGHYMLSGTCFCDYCLGEFLRAEGKDAGVVAQLETGAERHEWLKQQGLMPEYDRYLEEETYKIARWMREDLQRINPRFLFCVYVLEIGNWFCRGLARGLGTPELPVLDYAEATYCPGFCERVEKDMQRFREWGASVLYGGTLWYQFHPPADAGGMPAHMYNFCMGPGGYWFWPGNVLHDDWTSLPTHRGVPATQADYWHALVLANREIERKMAAPGQYVSPLADITPHPTWHTKSTPEDGYERRGCEVLPLHVAAPTRLVFYVPRRAHRVSVVLQAPGEGNGAAVALLDPEGKQAASASGELDEPERLEAEPVGGLWTLVVDRAGMALRDLGVRLEHVPPYVGTGVDSVLRPVEKSGPILALWSFDEGQGEWAGDTSGPPTADGALHGCAWAEGVRGKCLEFTGAGSHVRVPHNYGLDGLREFTLSAWVKLRALPEQGNGGSLINKGPEAPVQHFWWWIGYPPNYALVLEMGSENHKYGSSFASTPLEWELGRWYHVAVTYRWDGKQGVARFYRDGTLVGEQTKDEEFHAGDYDVILGSYHAPDIHWLQGWLDEVSIYDTALSAEEVKTLAAVK